MVTSGIWMNLCKLLSEINYYLNFNLNLIKIPNNNTNFLHNSINEANKQLLGEKNVS